jgi:hypothetical protein
VAPSFDQIREIVSGAPQMSHTLTALERCYQGYSTFLDVMMGMDHRSSLHYREFVNIFQGLKQEIEEEFGSSCLQCFHCSGATRSLRLLAISTMRSSRAPSPLYPQSWSFLWKSFNFASGRSFPRSLSATPPVRPGDLPISLLPPRLVPLPLFLPRLLHLLLPLPLPRLRLYVSKSNVAPNHVLMARFANTTRRLKDLTPARLRPAVKTASKYCVSRTYSVANVIPGVVDTLHTAPSLKPKCLELPNS